MIISRKYAQPNGDTFSIPPIKEFVEKWLNGKSLVVDPFARDSKVAHITNDLNPNTNAQYHLDSVAFLELVKQQYKPDAAIIDPPYSPRQIKELYDGIGLKMKTETAWRTQNWTAERDLIAEMKIPLCLSFGWNSTGMGKKRGYEAQEILLVCHGAGHNDTICVAEELTRPRLI